MTALDTLTARWSELEAIRGFLEWAANEHGVHLLEYMDQYEHTVPIDSERLTLEYIGVDPTLLETERRELLEQVQKLAAESVVLIGGQPQGGWVDRGP